MYSCMLHVGAHGSTTVSLRHTDPNRVCHSASLCMLLSPITGFETCQCHYHYRHSESVLGLHGLTTYFKVLCTLLTKPYKIIYKLCILYGQGTNTCSANTLSHSPTEYITACTQSITGLFTIYTMMTHSIRFHFTCTVPGVLLHRSWLEMCIILSSGLHHEVLHALRQLTSLLPCNTKRDQSFNCSLYTNTQAN